MTSIAEKLQKLEAELADVEAQREEAYDQLGVIEDLFKRNLGSGNNFGMYEASDKCEAFDIRLKILRSEIGILQSKMPRRSIPVGEWQTVHRRKSRRNITNE